jgi:acyl carrier protein
MSTCTETLTTDSRYVESKHIEHQVRAIVGAALSIDASQVPLHSRLVKDLGMDSLATMDILSGLEDAFSFTIDGLNPPPIDSLGDLVALAQLQVRRRAK